MRWHFCLSGYTWVQIAKCLLGQEKEDALPGQFRGAMSGAVCVGYRHMEGRTLGLKFYRRDRGEAAAAGEEGTPRIGVLWGQV